MDEELKQKLYKILSELPSENSWLDYKEIPYEESKNAEFIKDLCGFLNSKESYGKDKFIIIGVRDKTKEAFGIKSKPMQDDEFYQKLANIIQPRPSIEAGTIKFKINGEELLFGYIYITKDNQDRVYSICKTYPTIKRQRDLSDYEIKSIVYASTAYIRKGSRNYLLSEYDRREIYEMDRNSNVSISSVTPIYYDINTTSENDKILKAVIIFGGWNENNENDKEIISNFIGKPYNEWVLKLRVLLKNPNSFIEYKADKWKIKDRNNIIKQYASDFFKDELEAFKKIAISILSERNPKFDLDFDKRSMASFYNKTTKYSDLLRKSVAETLPIITANYKEFEKCRDCASSFSLLVTREVLKSNNWEVWASIEKFLPLLAESAPEEFLQQLDDKLKNGQSVIESLFNEKEYNLVTYNYFTGIYMALELTAWESRNFIESCMLLSKIAKYDKEAIKHIAKIILPWYPQTHAPIENRVIVVQNILKESPKDGWELIKDLMPGVISVASPSCKPKWNNIIEEDENKILQGDYWKQISIYIDLAILNSKTNTKKICDLIDMIDGLPENLFNKIYYKLSGNEIKNLSENNKYIIWNHLEDLIIHHKRTINAKPILSNENIKKLELLSSNLKPRNILIFAKRYFRRDTWNLIDDRKNYKAGEKELHQIQIELIQKILPLGVDNLITFAKFVENSYLVGDCVAEIKVNNELEFKILTCLETKNKSLIEFGKGYVSKKFILNGYDWIEHLNIFNWSKSKKLNLLLALPCTRKTFDLVSEVMSDNELDYWKKTNINFVKGTDELNYAIRKLLDAKRPEKVVWIVASKLYEEKKCDYDRETIIKCLKEMVHHQEILNDLDTYHIAKIISDLQESNVSKDELFNIEWIYLPLLDGEKCRPKVIEEMLSNDPSVYNDVLCLVYKPHSTKKNMQNVNENVAKNAYILLNQWELVPGLENGIVKKEKLNKWYNQMVDICSKSDRLEVALYIFGKVLYHAPKDKSGFWIDKNVAEILNQDNADKIRDGFYIEAYNSLGVINYDSEGSVFEEKSNEYYEKADLTDKEGFYRLAKEMRRLSDTYKQEAENTREHYFDYE